jgi:hypothetical protein
MDPGWKRAFDLLERGKIFYFSPMGLPNFIDGESWKCQIGEGGSEVHRPQGLPESRIPSRRLPGRMALGRERRVPYFKKMGYKVVMCEREN